MASRPVTVSWHRPHAATRCSMRWSSWAAVWCTSVALPSQPG